MEKIISKIALLGLFSHGKNRISYPLLLATVKISLHTAAVWSRLYPQYAGHGSWGHF